MRQVLVILNAADIEELLEAGIDVFTTVNVQHLESLNDVVSGVTGIQVRETVPILFSMPPTTWCWWTCPRTICASD
ncbi:two-component sensor kinase [Escherichia coli]|uniref:Two-component sensor kinase n=1 Tax=Escherichia coli TaxID=562 RepID=A0A484VSU2_ECOLX|nr:two-component sensor kinase [Escherichia coli]